jgi:hypothetical protein
MLIVEDSTVTVKCRTLEMHIARRRLRGHYNIFHLYPFHFFSQIGVDVIVFGQLSKEGYKTDYPPSHIICVRSEMFLD